jgi:hypothetical protein
MVLIGADSLRQLPLVVHAWQRALEQGLGAARVRGRLEAVELVGASEQYGPQSHPGGASGHHSDVSVLDNKARSANAQPVFDPASRRVLPHTARWSLPVLPDPGVPGVVHLHLLTPLRLQHNGRALGVAELAPRTLFSQLLRRVNLMLDLHLGIRPAPFDVHALLALAERLRDDRSELRWMDWTRYSARQQQEMPLGGVLGRWTLQGDDLAALLPWLSLGQWLHLGKNASLGMGAMRLQIGASPTLNTPAAAPA